MTLRAALWTASAGFFFP